MEILKEILEVQKFLKVSRSCFPVLFYFMHHFGKFAAKGLQKSFQESFGGYRIFLISLVINILTSIFDLKLDLKFNAYFIGDFCRSRLPLKDAKMANLLRI